MRRLLALVPLALAVAFAAPPAHASEPICSHWTHGCDFPAYVHEICVEYTTLTCP
ncbi:MAG TPA: hypothetical protein VFQ85_15875 [Mycobacteriales bacterium]|jgi:hypothetical protein|nr:hypothetical protein [Mycobacteriales bacterium]